MPFMRLNDHTVHFVCSVGKLYEKMELTDCIIVTKGGLIHAHKIILSVHSPYLKKLLMNHDGTTSFAFKEVEHNIMKLILDMMYYGEADVPDTDLALLTETAKLLQITSLRCASLNLSETFPKRNTSEDNNAPTCGLNVLGSVKRNLPVQENAAMCNQDVLGEREGGSNSGIENIDLQSIHYPETGERNILKEFSEKVNKDHFKGSTQNSSEIAKDVEWRDEEELQDELNPISFVAVPSVSVKSEEVDDEQSTSCISDVLLKNPLEEYPHGCVTSNKVNFKQEQEFLSESQMKTENKEEIADYEPKKGNSCSNHDPFINKVEQSFNESSANVEDNVLTDKEPVESILGISVLNDDCIVEGSEDLKVKFESICEISEFNLKEEKSFDADLDIGNTEIIEPLLLKQGSEAVNCGEEELSLIDCQQDVNQGLVLNETCGSSITEMKSMKNEKQLTKESREHQEYFNRLHPESVFNTQMKCSLPDTLEKHMESHTGPKSNTCGLCKKSFDRRIDLKRQKLSHTGEKLLSCVACEASFSVSSALKRHIQTHTGEKPYSCRTCEASFSSSSHLKRHMRTHTGEKSFSCDVCQVSFRDKEYLKVHMLCHTGEKPFTCGTCEVSFTTSSGLKRHMRTHTGEKPYSCSTCEASFSVSTSLKRHMRTHTEEKPFTCRTCEASFSVSTGLKRHMRTHTGGKPYSCRICEASFSVNRNLKVHTRTHTGEKPFVCGTCEASFSNSSHLKRHMRTHTGEKSFSCDVCQVSFRDKGNLKVHMLCHTGEKPFTCGTCEVSFTTSSSLKRHMRTHTGEKSFSCDVCQVSFRDKEYLKVHLLCHTGEKPFTCGTCEVSFTTRSKLKSHMRTHTGEKPYSCRTCEASFSLNRTLKVHTRTHTGEKPCVWNL